MVEAVETLAHRRRRDARPSQATHDDGLSLRIIGEMGIVAGIPVAAVLDTGTGQCLSQTI
jgi:hypothetical protein